MDLSVKNAGQAGPAVVLVAQVVRAPHACSLYLDCQGEGAQACTAGLLRVPHQVGAHSRFGFLQHHRPLSWLSSNGGYRCVLYGESKAVGQLQGYIG